MKLESLGVGFVENLFVDKLLFNYVDKTGQSKCIVAPDIGLKSGMCAKYSRLVAKMIFGIKYNRADAWNLRYVNDVVASADCLKNGRQGNLITFFNPLSKYNTKGNKNLDIKGNIRNCTHAGLLYDFDKNDEPVIIHQYYSVTEIGLLSDIDKKRGIQAVEIIQAKN